MAAYNILVDLHTHTLASGHAFGTVAENMHHGAERGLEAVAISDHFSPMFTPQENGRPTYGAMMNMDALPKEAYGVRLLRGVEIDIVDEKGRLYCWDLADGMLKHFFDTRDVIIASIHMSPWEPVLSPNIVTDMYIGALADKKVNVLGHPDRVPGYDIDAVLNAAKEYHKLIEINNHSLDFNEKTTLACRRLAERCAEENVPIVVNSDAHSPFSVGDFGGAIAMLEAIHFPEGLIANLTLEKFLKEI